jgi:chromosome segregation ATPase
MTKENSIPKKPSFGRRLWLALRNIVWFVFRLVLIVMIIAAIGVAVYYGGSLIINEYILKGVRTNTRNIAEIKAQHSLDSRKITDRFLDIQSRIDNLEIHQDSMKQSINDLETTLVSLEETLSDHSLMLTELNDLNATLSSLSASVSTLETRAADIESSLYEMKDELNEKLKIVNQTLENNQEEIDALGIQLTYLDTTEILLQELKLLKAMELITRARVSIGQENIGLAKNDLEAAQEILSGLLLELDSEQADYLAEISQRLSQAIKRISTSPGLAEEDLEIAWQMLIQGLPIEPSAGEGDTVQEEEAEATATPTPSPTPEP